MRIHKKADLDPAQVRATTFLYERDHALALCPTGSGKTVICMTALHEMIRDGHLKHPLIFAPLRVAQLVWPFEGAQWEHLQDFPLVNMAGAPASWPADPQLLELFRESRTLYGQRVSAERLARSTDDPEVEAEKTEQAAELLKEERRVNKRLRASELPKAAHLTSYENIEWLFNLYAPGKLPFDGIAFDEIGKLKNPTSPRAKLVKKHVVAAVKANPNYLLWGLNATPAPEGHKDLYMQVTLVDGGRLWGKSFYKWRERRFYPTDYNGYNWALQMGAAESIERDLNTLAIKISSDDLPYTKQIRFNQIPVELPPKAREVYREMEREFVVDVGAAEDIVALNEAAKSMKLRQICQGFLYDDEGECHILHQEKQHAFADLLDSMNGEPLLVAYDFREDLEALRRVYKGLKHLGYGTSAKAAHNYVNMWNDRQLPVLALHTYSVSHGLNLQYGGSNLAWFYIPWPLESFTQTNERVDRRGQTRQCFGHMIAARNTIEDRIAVRLQEKNLVQQDVLNAIRNV